MRDKIQRETAKKKKREGAAGERGRCERGEEEAPGAESE